MSGAGYGALRQPSAARSHAHSAYAPVGAAEFPLAERRDAYSAAAASVHGQAGSAIPDWHAPHAVPGTHRSRPGASRGGHSTGSVESAAQSPPRAVAAFQQDEAVRRRVAELKIAVLRQRLSREAEATAVSRGASVGGDAAVNGAASDAAASVWSGDRQGSSRGGMASAGHAHVRRPSADVGRTAPSAMGSAAMLSDGQLMALLQQQQQQLAAVRRENARIAQLLMEEKRKRMTSGVDAEAARMVTLMEEMAGKIDALEDEATPKKEMDFLMMQNLQLQGQLMASMMEAQQQQQQQPKQQQQHYQQQQQQQLYHHPLQGPMPMPYGHMGPMHPHGLTHRSGDGPAAGARGSGEQAVLDQHHGGGGGGGGGGGYMDQHQMRNQIPLGTDDRIMSVLNAGSAADLIKDALGDDDQTAGDGDGGKDKEKKKESKDSTASRVSKVLREQWLQKQTEEADLAKARSAYSDWSLGKRLGVAAVAATFCGKVKYRVGWRSTLQLKSSRTYLTDFQPHLILYLRTMYQDQFYNAFFSKAARKVKLEKDRSGKVTELLALCEAILHTLHSLQGQMPAKILQFLGAIGNSSRVFYEASFLLESERALLGLPNGGVVFDMPREHGVVLIINAIVSRVIIHAFLLDPVAHSLAAASSVTSAATKNLRVVAGVLSMIATRATEMAVHLVDSKGQLPPLDKEAKSLRRDVTLVPTLDAVPPDWIATKAEDLLSFADGVLTEFSRVYVVPTTEKGD